MTQYNSRKEPVFSDTKPTSTAQNQAAVEPTQPKIAISLNSNQIPAHSFNPVIKPTVEQPAQPVQVAQSSATEEPVTNTPPAPQGELPFSFTPLAEADIATDALAKESSPQQPEPVAAQEEVVVPPPVNNPNNIERVIPNASTTQTKSKTKKVKSVSPKYRRLFIVCLLALALLLLFFLLKPTTPATVEQLQEQNMPLPIEFRPVDEEEAKRAEEEAKRMEENARAAAAQAQQTMPQPNIALTSEPQPIVIAPATQVEPIQPIINNQAPIIVESIQRPTGSPSVIHQPEVRKVEPPKPEPTTTASVTKSEQAQLDKLIQAVEHKSEPVAKPTSTATTSARAVSTKTMTVPKGVSLMQVFRDNQLNISDVNAMSKANNVVSNLKVGEKITVQLDKNNRVVEMSIGSGGKFVRQANGSYTFIR